MVKALHEGLDRLMIALGGLTPHHKLEYVPPPPVDLTVPLGALLPPPRALNILWPHAAGKVVVDAPTDFLQAPNDQLALRWWPAPAGPRRGTAVLVPPWKLVTFTTMGPVVRGLNRLGYDVVGYPTPYHFERSVPGTFSGEFFATFDMPRTGWAVRAAALELCAVVEALADRGPVVMVGLSLGGYLSALMSVVAPLYPERAFGPARMCLVVPPESILDTLLDTPLGQRYRQMLEQNGGELPDTAYMARLAQPFSPARFPSAVLGPDILVLAGTHDHFVPLRSTRRLATGLGARLCEYPAGHLTSLVGTLGVWRDARDFLSELPFLPDSAA